MIVTGRTIHMSDLSAALGSNPLLFITLVFVLGLLVGSFLNVVIFRCPVMLRRDWEEQCRELIDQENAPREEGESRAEKHTNRFNLLVPGSHCLQCGHEITALENIPVLSYLFLKGRCSACGVHISARYPIVEILTAILVVVTVVGLAVFGPPPK